MLNPGGAAAFPLPLSHGALADKVSENFFYGLNQLHGRCEKCILIDGDCIKK